VRAAVEETAPTIESGTVVRFTARREQTKTASSEPRCQHLTERKVDMICNATRRATRAPRGSASV